LEVAKEMESRMVYGGGTSRLTLTRWAARLRKCAEPERVPAEVVVAVSPDVDHALVDTDWDRAAERALAEWGDHSLLHRVPVHGAPSHTSEKCERCVEELESVVARLKQERDDAISRAQDLLQVTARLRRERDEARGAAEVNNAQAEKAAQFLIDVTLDDLFNPRSSRAPENLRRFFDYLRASWAHTMERFKNVRVGNIDIGRDPDGMLQMVITFRWIVDDERFELLKKYTQSKNVSLLPKQEAGQQEDLPNHNDPNPFTSIPDALEEALEWLQELPGLEEFKRLGPDRYHHGIGRTIRNEWGFWKKEGPLYNSLVELGLEHPDDMSGLILQTLHNKLLGKPLNVKGQVAEYNKYWKQQEAK
jgi:hypothetical protein